MFQRDTLIHLVSGGIAGTAGAVVTCPLEVVKTRLQSSNPTFGHGPFSGKGSLGPASTFSPVNSRAPGSSRNLSTCVSCGRSAQILSVAHHSTPPPPAPATPRIGLGECLRLIYQKEGPQALFKGLGPNLVGVAPSRAIYFCSYSQAKKTFNQIFPTEAPIVHICSAATAVFD
ncbi:unnamed protein product [Allacma fusca]|uniref:Uncharacterized protein n=1 Tax=Allacma fusca TaxID=39272 RepID=A0A8J2JYN8_9HEXA|nr:unnamed protein product [Allacma fusca]